MSAHFLTIKLLYFVELIRLNGFKFYIYIYIFSIYTQCSSICWLWILGQCFNDSCGEYYGCCFESNILLSLFQLAANIFMSFFQYCHHWFLHETSLVRTNCFTLWIRISCIISQLHNKMWRNRVKEICFLVLEYFLLS